MVSGTHGPFTGSAGIGYLRMRTGRPSIQFAGRVLSRPISGVTISCGRPVPSRSAKRMRWTVGSSPIGNSSHGSSSVGPRRSHCSVPPDFVLDGFQAAPRAKSTLPSPSMSAAAMQTLSGRVWP